MNLKKWIVRFPLRVLYGLLCMLAGLQWYFGSVAWCGNDSALLCLSGGLLMPEKNWTKWWEHWQLFQMAFANNSATSSWQSDVWQWNLPLSNIAESQGVALYNAKGKLMGIVPAHESGRKLVLDAYSENLLAQDLKNPNCDIQLKEYQGIVDVPSPTVFAAMKRAFIRMENEHQHLREEAFLWGRSTDGREIISWATVGEPAYLPKHAHICIDSVLDVHLKNKHTIDYTVHSHPKQLLAQFDEYGSPDPLVSSSTPSWDDRKVQGRLQHRYQTKGGIILGYDGDIPVPQMIGSSEFTWNPTAINSLGQRYEFPDTRTRVITWYSAEKVLGSISFAQLEKIVKKVH